MELHQILNVKACRACFLGIRTKLVWNITQTNLHTIVCISLREFMYIVRQVKLKLSYPGLIHIWILLSSFKIWLHL